MRRDVVETDWLLKEVGVGGRTKPTRLGEVGIEEHFHVCYVHREGEEAVPNIEKSIFLHECIHVIVAKHR